VQPATVYARPMGAQATRRFFVPARLERVACGGRPLAGFTRGGGSTQSGLWPTLGQRLPHVLLCRQKHRANDADGRAQRHSARCPSAGEQQPLFSRENTLFVRVAGTGPHRSHRTSVRKIAVCVRTQLDLAASAAARFTLAARSTSELSRSIGTHSDP